MCNLNEWIVREAYRAYEQGDVTKMLDFVDPDLEWVFLEPNETKPQPRTCRGRGELEKGLRRQAENGLHAEIERVIAVGEKVILVMRTPGLGQYRTWHAEDRTYDVVTVRDGMITGLRACRDRDEAWSFAGLSPADR